MMHPLRSARKNVRPGQCKPMGTRQAIQPLAKIMPEERASFLTPRQASPDSVEFRKVAQHARRVPCHHTSRGYVLGDDAACTNDGATADVHASKNNDF